MLSQRLLNTRQIQVPKYVVLILVYIVYKILLLNESNILVGVYVTHRFDPVLSHWCTGGQTYCILQKSGCIHV